MNRNRDDFTASTKELLAKRVGYRCSNPACRRITCGPNSQSADVINIGVAAHICAAAQGGKRYDSLMTPAERKDYANGIWLCQTCAKLIDSDEEQFTIEMLKEWKRTSEAKVAMEIASPQLFADQNNDVELLKFFVQCFDRPAFHDDIHQEGRMEDFDKALEDTMIALNTGVLYSRDGRILRRAEGKTAMRNSEWREKLDAIADMLAAMRRRLSIAEKEKLFYRDPNNQMGWYIFYDFELGEWFNVTRIQIMNLLSDMCEEASLPSIHFAKRRYKW